MFFKTFITLLLFLCFANISHASNAKKFRDGTVIYKLKENLQPSELKGLNALFNKNKKVKDRVIKNINVHVIELENKGFEKKFIEELIATGAVEFAEPDYLVQSHITPNDEYFYLQWHHSTINSETAWDKTLGDSSVIVAVCDTGVDTDHPDLVDNLLPGYNAVYNSSYVEDSNGHGTWSIGSMAAVGNNDIGVAGVVWNTKVIPVKITDGASNSAYISDMAEGIREAADRGAKVVNLSFGGAEYSTIDSAAQYLKDKGGLLFMSAGNSGTYHSTNDFPDFQSFVVVGATGYSDTITNFSEYGPYIDIVAPGEDIATTGLDSQYSLVDGTSFSSPIAAGLAALIFSVNPDFTPNEVESLIFNTAVDLGTTGEDDLYGNGRIDVNSAINAAIDSITVDDFTLYNILDAYPSHTYRSNEISINGLDCSTVIASTTAGTLVKNNQETNTSSVNVTNGDTIKVKINLSNDFNNTTSVSLTVGKQSKDFSITTLASFFDDIKDANKSTDYTSNPFEAITDGNISIDSGVLIKNNIELTSQTTTVTNGDMIEIKLTSSNDLNNTVTSNVIIGDINDSFSVTTSVYEELNVDTYSIDANTTELYYLTILEDGSLDIDSNESIFVTIYNEDMSVFYSESNDDRTINILAGKYVLKLYNPSLDTSESINFYTSEKIPVTEYTSTSYYVAYDSSDPYKYALVMPMVNKIYTHRAGEITNLTRVDEQFTSFPVYNDGQLCFSSLVANASGESGASTMEGTCHEIKFFYIQKEAVSSGTSFMLYYKPDYKVYEGIAGQPNSFEVVKDGDVLSNINSITNEDYTTFWFDIANSKVVFQE